MILPSAGAPPARVDGRVRRGVVGRRAQERACVSRGDRGLPRVSRDASRCLAAATALAAAALALGVIAPPASSGSGDARVAGGPHLLVSIYGDDESTLWLVDPADPSRRQALFPLAHAPGWAPAGAVSPAGGRMALLVVRPGARDPATDTLLLLSDGGPPRVVARGLDLRGGLAWSSDGAELFARRTLPAADGSRRFQMVAFDLRRRRRARRADAAGARRRRRALPGRPGGRRSGLRRRGGGGRQRADRDRGGRRDLRAAAVAGRDAGVVALARGDAAGLHRAAGHVAAGDAARPRRAGAAHGTGDRRRPGERRHGLSRLASRRDAARRSLRRRRRGPDGGGERGGGRSRASSLPLGWSPDGAYLALRTFGGTGPGDPGAQGLAVLGPDGTSRALTGEGLAILGWWHGVD